MKKSKIFGYILGIKLYYPKHQLDTYGCYWPNGNTWITVYIEEGKVFEKIGDILQLKQGIELSMLKQIQPVTALLRVGFIEWSVVEVLCTINHGKRGNKVVKVDELDRKVFL